jgi:hypothetical protein
MNNGVVEWVSYGEFYDLTKSTVKNNGGFWFDRISGYLSGEFSNVAAKQLMESFPDYFTDVANESGNKMLTFKVVAGVVNSATAGPEQYDDGSLPEQTVSVKFIAYE